MNHRALQRRLDRVEENLGRLLHLLPGARDLTAYTQLSQADALAIGEIWWPVIERLLEERGEEICLRSVRMLVEELRGERHPGESRVALPPLLSEVS